MLLQIIRGITVVYKLFVSPILHFLMGPGFGCRYIPTCSQYSADAFQNHGFLKGLILTLRRLSRCHPFAQAGYDPAPHDIGGHCLKPHINQGR
jgi:putative membrane protein insertion efficiency factor